MDIAPQHPIIRPGIVVSIGLDKNTKLSAVFNRYVDFCNESSANDRIHAPDLEFLHCQLLSGSDTAESSALMKNDKISVRKACAAQREADQERKRMKRDADRTFFQQMRHLMPDLGGSKTSDVLLDCQGKLIDEKGRNQKVLCTTVRAHSAILSKRCPWLGAIIQKARNEAVLRDAVEDTITPDDASSKAGSVRQVESDGKSADEEEDDGIAVLSFPPKEEKEDEASGAAEIENDDEDELPYDGPSPRNVEDTRRLESPVVVPSEKPSKAGKRFLWVALPEHAPEAVKLLLEYCYTNRVLHLGHEAFVQGCKTRPHKHQGPVPPYQSSSSGSRRWPNNGYPVVSFSVALAGIALAEQAGMHRLSLMCEVAASQLLSTANVVEALSICTSQKNNTGNDLARLRKAAMDVVLRSGSRGVVELGRTPAFRRALEERRSFIVPTLLQGTMEAVTAHDKTRGVKRDRTDINYPSFEELDREDSYKRERERRKRRLERWEKDPSRRAENAFDEELDDFYDPILSGWGSETAKRSLKRMSHHLDAIASRQASAFPRSKGHSFPTSSRQSSSRRRSNQS